MDGQVLTVSYRDFIRALELKKSDAQQQQQQPHEQPPLPPLPPASGQGGSAARPAGLPPAPTGNESGSDSEEDTKVGRSLLYTKCQTKLVTL